MPQDHIIENSASILLVFGPTASGKTALAVQLAKSYQGEIINGDSMQIYDGLPILTALPSADERQGIAHHLFGEIAANDGWSVGKWCTKASRLIAQIRQRGRRPIIVGGTGLYFDALTKGLAQIPAVEETVKSRLEAVLAQDGVLGLRDLLTQADPQSAARIQGADQQRLMRALGVFWQTGKTLTSFQQNTVPVLAEDQWTGLVLLPSREQVYTRINQRFEQMVTHGAVEEVRRFNKLWADQKTALDKAIGLGSIREYLLGSMSLDAAISQAQRDSRRYAKRQFTWAKGRASLWNRFDTGEAVLNFLSHTNRDCKK